MSAFSIIVRIVSRSREFWTATKRFNRRGRKGRKENAGKARTGESRNGYRPPSQSLLRRGLDENCCAISEHLGDTLHDLGGVITDADYGVGAQLLGVLQHQREGLFAGALAEIGEQSDVSADQGL